jgi:tetratricopeptide (TPR) repeat protein
MDTTDPLLARQASAYSRCEMGLFREALASAEEAVELAQDRFGPVHPSIASYLIDLATLQRKMARYPAAEANLKWALALRERAFGPRDPSVREVLGHLTALYDDLGRWEEAEPLAKRALSMFPATPSRGRSEHLARVGRIRQGLGDASGARAFLQESLRGTPPDVPGPGWELDTLSFLAEVEMSGGRMVEAERTLQKALELTRTHYPEHSREKGRIVEGLGDLYRVQKQEAKAKARYEEGLTLLKRFVGVYFEFPALEPMQDLIRAYQAVGDHLNAKDLLMKALAASRQAYDPGHPQTGLLLLSLSISERALGDRKASEAHRKEAARIFRAHFAPGHPLVLKATAAP